MNYIIEDLGDIVVFSVNVKRATLRESEDFKDALLSKVENTKKIVVDLTNCEFVDSIFVGALVLTLKRLVSANGDLKLCGLQPMVKEMFELTRMHKVFEIFDNREQALGSF